MIDKHVFNGIRDDIRSHLKDYMSRRGYDVAKNRFRCPNPSHPDKNPSCGLVPNHPEWGHCFSCGESFDIFTLCIWEESKPAGGTAWFKDVFLYLAEKFNIPVPDMKFSADELFDMEIANAYSHASQIIRSLDTEDVPKIVAAKLLEYGWSRDVQYKMGIGSVKSYDEYIKRMTTNFGHSLDFLKKTDLANRNLFNPECLIYTIRDADGQPVGFSARDLNYEAKELAYKAAVKKGDTPEFAPKKYCHTTNNGNQGKKNLFNKSEIIFNFDLARLSPGGLVIMEGNADCATAYAAGIHSAVAALGTAFQRSHIEQALAAGKDRIVLVFDGDTAGKRSTERVMTMIEEMGGHVGLQVQVLQLPDGFKDPDEYIRSFTTLQEGSKAFRALPKIDMFTWRLQKAIEGGEDPEDVCTKTLPLIINEEQNLARSRMCDQLAYVTGIDAEFLRREVLRLTDQASMRLDEERALVGNDLMSNVRKDPKRVGTHILKAQAKLDSIEKRAKGCDVKAVIDAAKGVQEHQLANVSNMEMRTGFPLFDKLIGGVPRKGLFGTMPGKSHHGKSIWMDNLINGMIDNNEDLIVVLHSVDDAMEQRVQRIFGARTGIPSEYWRSAGYYLHDPKGQSEAPADFERIYTETWDWYLRMMADERLIAVDSGVLANDLQVLKIFIAELQRKHPGKSIIVFGDNFHLYDLATEETGEAKISAMSVYVTTELIAGLGISAIFTVEIPKGQFEIGLRPSYQNLKGTGRLTFDSKLNMTVYNQLQDFTGPAAAHKVALWWESDKYMESQTDEAGIICMAPVKLPIIEIIVDKNKISGRKRTLFYRLDDRSGVMTECTEAEQISMAEKLSCQEEQNRKSSRASYKHAA